MRLTLSAITEQATGRGRVPSAGRDAGGHGVQGAECEGAVRARGACARERGTGRNAGGHGVSALKFLELLEFLQPLPKKQKHSITF